jgi:hypothetical protein
VFFYIHIQKQLIFFFFLLFFFCSIIIMNDIHNITTHQIFLVLNERCGLKDNSATMDLLLQVIISALQNWYNPTIEKSQSEEVINSAIQLMEENTKGYTSLKLLSNSELVGSFFLSFFFFFFCLTCFIYFFFFFFI